MWMYASKWYVLPASAGAPSQSSTHHIMNVLGLGWTPYGCQPSCMFLRTETCHHCLQSDLQAYNKGARAHGKLRGLVDVNLQFVGLQLTLVQRGLHTAINIMQYEFDWCVDQIVTLFQTTRQIGTGIHNAPTVTSPLHAAWTQDGWLWKPSREV